MLNNHKEFCLSLALDKGYTLWIKNYSGKSNESETNHTSSDSEDSIKQCH